MTRKEIIEREASSIECDAKTAFKLGIKWAENNPDWHKYPDTFPTQDGIYIIHSTTGGFKTVPYYACSDGSEGYWGNLTMWDMILEWIELPKFRRYEDD